MRRIMACAMLAVFGLFAAGCPDQNPDRTARANLSLIEIGERSLDRGERLEREGKHAEALELYRQAEWAFSYHESLTGDAPLFLDDAQDKVSRLSVDRARPGAD